ncbi:4Fe-4S binding protein [Desulfocurvus sp.]|jgi:ferredoxin|uniref:4Fe-4S binding protein n=1 Tax=Desulfocurvus sp. TaxID=2871698 RepID=UPI0025BDB678|nr:4Fe-4S binding protein [Desulfocurvus sp.]MCK9240161.1 4Fe-4S binding protein [Desulfocurvus sp.]
MPLIKPSTLRYLKEAAKLPRYPLLERLHGYVYLRWPYLYIGLGLGTHPLARLLAPLAALAARIHPLRPDADTDPQRVSWADSYHGKALPLEEARRLVTVRRDIDIRDLEKIIPYKRARDLVLRNPERIVALECPCRRARENPCLPLDVCLIIGEPFAGFVLEHHPDKSRPISPEEAVEILEREDRRGHVHHAFFKEAMLGRFYAICNCCSCCCGAMQAQRNGIPMLCSSGFVAELDPGACVHCGLCASRCQFRALSHADGATRLDPSLCMGCGVCVNACPRGALSLRRDAARGEPLEIEALLARAAGTAP